MQGAHHIRKAGVGPGTGTPPNVRHPEDGVCATELVPLVLDDSTVPVGPAAWPPPGHDTRHFTSGTTPDLADLVHALDTTG